MFSFKTKAKPNLGDKKIKRTFIFFPTFLKDADGKVRLHFGRTTVEYQYMKWTTSIVGFEGSWHDVVGWRAMKAL